MKLRRSTAGRRCGRAHLPTGSRHCGVPFFVAGAIVVMLTAAPAGIAHAKCDPLDGQVAFAEECDDGNLDDNDACTSDCLWNVCGDGKACTGTGTPGSECGTDGPTLLEQCDKGAEAATCDADCTLVQCGDAYPNLTAGEECDDGNGKSDDGCKNDCHRGRDEQLLALDALKAASLVPVEVWFENGIPTSVSMQVPLGAAADDPVAGALSFLVEFAALYRIEDPTRDLFLDRVSMDPELISVRFGQRVGDVPFRGGEIAVFLDAAGEVVGTHGRWHVDLPATAEEPLLQPEEAEAAAIADVTTLSDTATAAATKLVYYDTGFVQGEPSTPRLCWRVVLGGEREQDGGRTIADYYVDAFTGEIVWILDREQRARDFDLSTANGDTSISCWDTWDDPTTQWFTESGRTRAYRGGDADGDAMWALTNSTYDWWLRTYGRRSWDGSDEQVEVYAHVGGAPNAFALDDCLKFTNGMFSTDVYAHEFAHGIDHETAELDYQFQSGAVSESLADFFGVAVAGFDNWYFGEGTAAGGTCTGGPAGAARNLSDPPTCGAVPNVMGGPPVPDPDHMSAFRRIALDNGGVHTNSGILNKAFFLIADGGTHRGITIPPDLGRSLTAFYLYRTLTQRLTEESQIIDVRNEFLNAMRGVGDARPPAIMFSLTALCRVRNAFAAVGLAPTALDTDCDGTPDTADPDTDDDGVPSSRDNCDGIASADQTDSDGDGAGDLCDADNDSDGICDFAGPALAGTPGTTMGCQRAPSGRDNCRSMPNVDQRDFDNDGTGDACEDSDGDGVFDNRDNCPTLVTAVRTDADNDGTGDACDPDDDNDRICDQNGPEPAGPGALAGCNRGTWSIDTCPNRWNAMDQGDADGDILTCNDPLPSSHRSFGCGDHCDSCPAVFNDSQTDLDRDGTGDACDDDDDGDGVPDASDNCPTVRNAVQNDLDGDGYGTACDPDDWAVLRDTQGTLVTGLLGMDGQTPLEIRFPSCDELDCTSWLSPTIERRLLFELPSPMRVQIIDDDGKVVAKSDADLNPTLRFVPDPQWYYVPPAIVPIGAATRAHAERALRSASPPPYVGKQYTLRIFPGKDASPTIGASFAIGSLQAQRCAPAPVETCKLSMQPGDSSLAVRKSAKGSRRIVWKVAAASAAEPDDFGDPTAGGSYALCFYEEDTALPHLVAELLVPGGGQCGDRPCWKSTRTGKTGQGWHFSDSAGNHDGIRTIGFRSGSDGESVLMIKASGSDVPVPPLPAMLPMRVQLQASDGACWQATYLPGSAEVNDETTLQAAGD
ncbi:MAG TPA: M4 family metallopeptidase [Candidatus Limnocylindrales bacterium]|nr:M4 family metallopeptidase [Candidatus Limnocylindrales bacterium]